MIGILDLRHLEVAGLVEHRRRHHQDRHVDDEGDVEGHGRVQVVPEQRPPGLASPAEVAGLHQGGVQIEVVGHHGGPDDTDGDVERGGVRKRGDEPVQEGDEGRLGEEHLHHEGDADGCHQA